MRMQMKVAAVCAFLLGCAGVERDCSREESMNANGENRRYLALAFGAAMVAAVGTKLGEWAVERLRKVVQDAPAERKS